MEMRDRADRPIAHARRSRFYCGVRMTTSGAMIPSLLEPMRPRFVTGSVRLGCATVAM